MSATTTVAPQDTSAGEGENTGATTTGQAPEPAPTGEQQQPTTEKTFTQADVDRIIKARLTEERRKADQARADAELSEVAKRDQRIAELEGRVTAAEQKEREYALRDAIAETVGTKDFAHILAPGVSAAKVLRFLDSDAVEWSERGEPANVRALLTGLAKSDPYLFAQPRVPSGDGGAGRGGAGVPPTMTQIIRQGAGRE